MSNITRQEIASLSDVELTVRYDGVCRSLRRSWMRGEPGKLSDAFTLGLLISESHIRQYPLRPLAEFEQLRMDL